MSERFSEEGFEVIRGVYGHQEIASLIEEADRVAIVAESVCVRHLRAQSVLFDQLCTSAKLLALLPKGMVPVRSILFDKTPQENWPVLWHQDLTIAVKKQLELDGYGPWSVKNDAPHVQPPQKLLGQMRTIRIHLDDTPASNGALRVIPQSHKLGKIPTDKVSHHVESGEVICECNAGDVLMMCPLTLHASRRSESSVRRRVLHFEYAFPEDLHPDLTWLE